MAFNGSGVFVRLYNWVNDAAANIKIRADRMDNEMNGFATGLSTCITKDGQTTITANLPMASYRHTGVGDATARTQYSSFAQLQDGKANWVDGGGTADAITASYTIPVTALVDGQLFYVRATAANATTTPTFNPSALGALTITKNGGQALVPGDIAGDGYEMVLRYRLADTEYELLNPANVVATAPFADTTAIVKGSSDATKLARFEVDGFTTATTRVVTLPDADTTMVGTATTQTLTNKTFTDCDANTQTVGNNTTKVATTAFVQQELQGALFNFQQAQTTTPFTTSSSSYTDVTGVSVSITPKSASDKVLVRAVLQVGTPTNVSCAFQLVRGSTPIGIATSVGSRTAAGAGAFTAAAQAITTVVLEWLDEPATTSSTTYKVQAIVHNGSGTIAVNASNTDTNNSTGTRAVSVISVCEVHA
jgi:hypothetical protein